MLQARFKYDPETGKLYLRDSDKEEAAMCNSGYKATRVSGDRQLVHRIIWEMHYGTIPEKCEIDHINHIKTDNRLENLRLTTRKGNSKNLKRSYVNKTGITGVHKRIRDSGNVYWQSEIKVNGRNLYLGISRDFFEACCRRKSAENKYGFHANHGK